MINSNSIELEKLSVIDIPNFGNTCEHIDDEKYPLLKRDNLTVPIQMQFAYKDKRFSNFFYWIFEI